MYPADWAKTQNNLGNALRNLAERTEDAKGVDLLGEAVAAYQSALEVWTRGAHPEMWAKAQNNLGVALNSQAARTRNALEPDSKLYEA